MKKTKKCEAETYSGDEFRSCGRKAKYKIKDIVCEGLGQPFWICSKCIKNFVTKNEKESHYKILEKIK